MFCLTPLALVLQIAKVPQIHADLLLVFKMLPPGRIGLVPLLLACQHAEAQFLLEVALGLLVAGLEQPNRVLSMCWMKENLASWNPKVSRLPSSSSANLPELVHNDTSWILAQVDMQG